MNSILNHGNLKPQSPNNGYSQSQSRVPNQSIHSQQQAKISMKNLYKNQLDAFMQEKQRQKRLEKELLAKQKQEYTQKVKMAQENQRMKDIAYKNYYKMLMESHQQNSGAYVSPYQMRDKLKDSHIQHSINQETQKAQSYEYEKRMRELQRRNQYKEQLTRQIQERRKIEEMKKQQAIQEKSFYRQHTRGPQQLEFYQRERKKEEMEQYKHDLDRLMQQKLSQSRKNTQQLQPSNSFSQPTQLSEYHNPVTNPVPYNIQNPYILRQMQKLPLNNNSNSQSQNVSLRNDSYLGNQGAGYGQQGYYQERPRNQSSYFARQGNRVLK